MLLYLLFTDNCIVKYETVIINWIDNSISSCHLYIIWADHVIFHIEVYTSIKGTCVKLHMSTLALDIKRVTHNPIAKCKMPWCIFKTTNS